MSKNLTFNGKDYEVTRARFFPLESAEHIGIQGTLSIELDNLFWIRLKLSNIERNGKIHTAFFGPSIKLDDEKWYTQADFTAEAKTQLTDSFLDLVEEIVEEGIPQATTRAFFANSSEPSEPKETKKAEKPKKSALAQKAEQKEVVTVL